MTNRMITATFRPERGHWVGDGFPVRQLFGYGEGARARSPFLMLDYAGPYEFAPSQRHRGVDTHPHKGFETVTIVYDGEVSHRDSSGAGGTIAAGDVQWMTAGAGVLHDEFHSDRFTRDGGRFEIAQLWVNLPARHKSAAPGYQALTADQIPQVTLPEGVGILRVIAGDHAGHHGPARTFTPINLWDLRLNAGANLSLPLPEGHHVLIAVLDGGVEINGQPMADATLVTLSNEGASVSLRAQSAGKLLVMTGEPIDEPVVGHGPFVMTSEAEIRQAFADYRAGKFGQIN